MFTYNAIAIEVASQFPLISYPTLCPQIFQFSKDRHSNTFMETSGFFKCWQFATFLQTLPFDKQKISVAHIRPWADSFQPHLGKWKS